LEQTVKYSPIPSYFNSLYSIWNKRRRKAFHDPRRAPWKRELFLEFTLFLFIFIRFLKPNQSWFEVTSIILFF